MDLQEIAARVAGLTQPLQERRDYGSEEEEEKKSEENHQLIDTVSTLQ